MKKNLHKDERIVYVILHLLDLKQDYVTLIIYNFYNNTKIICVKYVCVCV